MDAKSVDAVMLTSILTSQIGSPSPLISCFLVILIMGEPDIEGEGLPICDILLTSALSRPYLWRLLWCGGSKWKVWTYCLLVLVANTSIVRGTLGCRKGS